MYNECKTCEDKKVQLRIHDDNVTTSWIQWKPVKEERNITK